MRRLGKVLVVLAALMAATVLGSTFLVAATVVTSGVVTVEVDERRHDGLHLYLPVPAALVEVSAGVAALVMPPEARRELERELGEWAPAIEDLLLVLEDCPDATLVEVEDRGELVRVVKRGRTLRVLVDQEDVYVNVSVPTRAVRRAVSRLLG